MKKIEVTNENIESAIDKLSNLSPELSAQIKTELEIVCAASSSLLTVAELVSGNGKINDIRKYLNIYPEKKNPPDDSSSQAMDELEDEYEEHSSKKPSSTKKINPNINKNHKGRQSASDFEVIKTVTHEVCGLAVGQNCPECSGKLYLHKREGEPRTRIWFTASPPIFPTHHVFNDLICNLCKKVYEAKPSNELIEDGYGKEDRFGYSAIAMITIMKYFEAIPWYRYTSIHDYFNIHLPESTLYDQVVKMAEALRPIYSNNLDITAQSSLFYGDDTSYRILEKDMAIIPNRKSGNSQARDGCHSSVVIGLDDEGHKIVNVKTDIIYLGEWLDKILALRRKGLAPPLVMSDGSSQNQVTITDVINLDCNQHARKMFEVCEKHFPKQVDEILKIYKKIFKNDRKTWDMPAEERLRFHQENTTRLFDLISEKIRGWIEAKLTPENSPFGKACSYFLSRESSLRGILTYPDAPLSNNLSETQMIKIALLRNVCKMFKTERSAEVASIIFSVGLTALLTKEINLFEYFTAVLKFSEDVKGSPSKFLPWNYQETIKAIAVLDH